MIDTVLNLIFRCSHRRLTRPITPVVKAGQRDGGTYVVCLDCGKQFGYDPQEMRIGKPIDRSETIGVLPPITAKPRKAKLGLTLLAAVPAVFVLGAALKSRKKPAAPAAQQPVAPEDRRPAVAEREETLRREG
jgi:DNA-directed RNA polymerase subunit RPC12/RpoP